MAARLSICLLLLLVVACELPESTTSARIDGVATALCGCEPLPPASGRIIVARTVAELNAAVQQANAGGDATILLEDGTYTLASQLAIRADRVTVRSRSGHRDAVTLRSASTLVERNVVIDCDRGIGFGLGTRGHVGGTIRNNMIYTTRDVGIGLESSPGTLVQNNSVFVDNYPQAIEYRFPSTSGVSIVDNLTNAAIVSRDGGSGTLAANVTNAAATWFVDHDAGDLHLAHWFSSVIDRGVTLPGVEVDIDCEPRPHRHAPDIGADEFWPPARSRRTPSQISPCAKGSCRVIRRSP